MIKVKYYFYELFSVSLGLAVLAFFGTLSFFPMEIMLMGDGQTWYWVFIILCLSAIIAFVVLSFYKKDYSFLILRAFDIAATICTILATVFFIIFTKDLLEPWLVQGAWFLRYNGLLIGVLLGCVLMKTVTGLSFLITKFNEREDPNNTEENLDKEKSFELLTLILVVSSFLFYIIEILLYRYLSLLNVFLFIFLLQIIILILSLFLITRTDYQDYLKLNIFQREDSSRFLKKINTKLIESGTVPRNFWQLFIPLLFIAVFSVITIIIYPYNILFTIAFPFQGVSIHAIIPLFQLLTILLILITFSILTFVVFGIRSKQKFGNHSKRTLGSRLKIGTFGLLDAMKFIGLFLVISQVIYFFNYPIYFPKVVSFVLLFGIIGAIIYFALGRTQLIKNILYIVSILFLVLNLYIVYIDGVTYGQSYWDGSFDIIFPFVYLHSLLNFILIGIPIGIIISDFMLNFAFKNTDGTDSTHRALLLAFSSFVFAMLIMPGNFLLNNPGGDVPLTDSSIGQFFLFCAVLMIILIVSLGIHLISEVLIPWLNKRKRARIIENLGKKKPLVQSPKDHSLNKKENFQKRAAAISIAVIMVLSVFGGLIIFFTYRENYKKPVLVYSPGNYYVWLQNSSERVSKDFMIAVDASPRIDAVELSLAKNEYGAFQLVWRSLGKEIECLTYEISDFKHQKSAYEINSDSCSLRYEEFVIEEEFPDILVPFEKLDLKQHENTIFWFSIKTPYDTPAGEYHGKITFNFNKDESEIIKIHLNIWNFTIPKMRHLRTNVGNSLNNLKQYKNYFYHRMNDYGVTIYHTEDFAWFNSHENVTCYLNTTSNEWSFNWTWWDNLTEYKLNNSMNAFTVSYPLGLGGRDPPIEDDTWLLRLKNWLSDVQDHMVDKGWLNYSYYYFIDEFSIFIPAGYTREEYFDRLETLLKEMKVAAPKIKIMVTTPPSEELKDLRKYIDIFCPVSADRDKDRWDERLDAGVEFWFYACVGPMAPWPNSHLYNRLYESRILLWQTWYYKLHGFLYWSSSAYYHGNYGLAYNGYGDGWFIYEREGKLYDSLRWENYLDGNEDYEYLWLIDAVLDFLKESGRISDSKRKKFRDEYKEIVNSIVGEKWEYCDHPSIMYSGRDRIGCMLHELSSYTNITAIGEALWLPPYYPGM